MARNSYVQLAQVYIPGRHHIPGHYVSEKLDGIRCFWDGGVSRGVEAKDVPFANTEKDKSVRIATGLWSRYLKVISAPDWWLNKLPPFPLDGELTCGRQTFQRLVSAVKKHEPVDSEWSDVVFKIWATPDVRTMFYNGVLTVGDTSLFLRDVPNWFETRMQHERGMGTSCSFETMQRVLEIILEPNEVVTQLHQEKLPGTTDKALTRLYEKLDEVTSQGGEGLILQAPHAMWVPERTSNTLKVKKEQDAEGVIIGFKTGLGKLRGLIGAVKVLYNQKVFELSGFTDEERSPYTDNMSDWAYSNPGADAPEDWHGKYFWRGDIIPFKFRELTKDGLPKEARFNRAKATPRTNAGRNS